MILAGLLTCYVPENQGATELACNSSGTSFIEALTAVASAMAVIVALYLGQRSRADVNALAKREQQFAEKIREDQIAYDRLRDWTQASFPVLKELGRMASSYPEVSEADFIRYKSLSAIHRSYVDEKSKDFGLALSSMDQALYFAIRDKELVLEEYRQNITQVFVDTVHSWINSISLWHQRRDTEGLCESVVELASGLQERFGKPHIPGIDDTGTWQWERQRDSRDERSNEKWDDWN